MTTHTHRRLLSVVVLKQIRERHQKLMATVARGRVPPQHALGTMAEDMQTLIEAYEAATDRLRNAQRILDGET